MVSVGETITCVDDPKALPAVKIDEPTVSMNFSHNTSPLSGQDALYSIVQMPPGIPVATVGIGNAKNAGLLAVQVLGCGDPSLWEKMTAYRRQFGDDAS